MRFVPPAPLLPTADIEEFEYSQISAALEKIRDQFAQSEGSNVTNRSFGNEWLEDWRRDCFELPAKLLSQYEADRHGSQLARILAKTKRMMAVVDRVVVLGMGGYCSASRALMDTCCQPYFNHLSRGQRGSRPRIFFVDEYLDNDAAQGLLHMLGVGRPGRPQSVEESWAVVAISNNTHSPENRMAVVQLLNALEVSCNGDQDKVRERFIPITGSSGYLRDVAEHRGHNEIFPIPEKSPAGLSAMSAVGLVPAALMGINVIWLLTGGAQIYKHFLTEKLEQNIVLQFAAVNHWGDARQDASKRAMRIWSQSLENAVRWYDLLLKDCLGWRNPSVVSITNAQAGAVSVDAASPDLTLPAWVKRQSMIYSLVVEKHRFDPLPAWPPETADKGVDDTAENYLPELMSSAIERSHQALIEAGCLAPQLIFPRIDEYFMGQFFQILALSTALEVSLQGSDPYGQEAIEPYKVKYSRRSGL